MPILRLTKERTDGKAFQKRMKPVLNMRCPAENGRLSVDGNCVLLAVTLDGNLATRFFVYSVLTGMNTLGGGPMLTVISQNRKTKRR